MFSRNRHIYMKGGALYYVIFVVFVLTAISSLYLIHRGIKQRQVHHEIGYFTCMDDLNSALSFYLSEPEKYQHTPKCSIVLFEDSTRKVAISHKSYGLLDLVTAERNYAGKIFSKTVLAGKNPFHGDSLALYVPDRRQPLYASGNTRIAGNARLPAKGLERAAIEGKPLQSAEVIRGTMLTSGETLPRLATTVLNKLERLNNLDSLCQKAFPLSELCQSSLEVPLSEPLQWYGSEDDFQISGFSASGAIGFCSTGTIWIRNDAVIRGSLVAAKSIIIEEGFEGGVQLFAQDSLIIGTDCNLEFPSVISLSSEQVNKLYMNIGKSTTIEGTVVVHQPLLAAKKPLLVVDEEVLIRGQVYHQGRINLRGKIHGSLYCEEFYLKTQRAYYENHLLDNEIDFLKLPELFVSIDLIQGYHDQIIDVVDQSL